MAQLQPEHPLLQSIQAGADCRVHVCKLADPFEGAFTAGGVGAAAMGAETTGEAAGGAGLTLLGFGAGASSSTCAGPASTATGFRFNKTAPSANRHTKPMMSGHFNTSTRPETC